LTFIFQLFLKLDQTHSSPRSTSPYQILSTMSLPTILVISATGAKGGSVARALLSSGKFPSGLWYELSMLLLLKLSNRKVQPSSKGIGTIFQQSKKPLLGAQVSF